MLDHAGREVSLGTVYTTLLRLEAKGLIAAHLGEPTPARGGRRKKHYAVNARGRTALQRYDVPDLRLLSNADMRVLRQLSGEPLE